MNRSRTGADEAPNGNAAPESESSPAAEPAASETPPITTPARRGRRRTPVADAPLEQPALEASEAPADASEPVAAIEASEDAPSTGPARRSRGGRRPRSATVAPIDVPDEPIDNEPGDPDLADAAPIQTGEEFAASEELTAMDSEAGVNPDIDSIAAEIDLDSRDADEFVPESQAASGERFERPYGQRTRGGRGRRGGADRPRPLDTTLEQRPRRPNLDDLRPRRPDIEEQTPQRARRPDDRQRRPEGDGQRTPQPSQQGGRRPEGLESLVARQNVLFEEFAQQQGQALREVQRTVSNLGRGGAPSSSGGHTLALPKVALFLDVPNLIYTSEQMGVRVHFGRLLDYLTEGRQLVRATAYAPITDDPTTRFETQRFVAPVIGHGYKIVSKPWKRFADGSMKANFDIELAVDILTMSDRLDIVVLLSGDGDFRRVCELVESKGVRVEVVAFAASTAMELRTVADQYTDLAQIMNIVGV